MLPRHGKSSSIGLGSISSVEAEIHVIPDTASRQLTYETCLIKSCLELASKCDGFWLVALVPRHRKLSALT